MSFRVSRLLETTLSVRHRQDLGHQTGSDLGLGNMFSRKVKSTTLFKKKKEKKKERERTVFPPSRRENRDPISIGAVSKERNTHTHQSSHQRKKKKGRKTRTIMGQITNHLNVVPRHDHLLTRGFGTLRERQLARHVCRSEVHLGSVLLDERGVPSTLLLRQDLISPSFVSFELFFCFPSRKGGKERT